MDDHSSSSSSTPAAEGFDFELVEFVDTAAVEIKDPTRGHAPTGWIITVASEVHPIRKAWDFKQRRLKAARMAASLSKGKGIPTDDPEDAEADLIERLVACTLGWTGSKVAYTPAAARALYSDPRRVWVRRQVIESLDDIELFTRSSARS